MSKQEIYEYLRKNAAKLFTHGIQKIKQKDVFKEINYDFKDAQDLYDYLNNTQIFKCRYKNCNKKRKFLSFTQGYRHFCSAECNNKWLSETRTGKGNPIHRITNENRIKWKATLSFQVKERIKKGTWTPESTNSWCHSRYKIQFIRNNQIIKQNVRSSWEAIFQLLNINLEYEKLRIPYFYNGEWHNYIVDFIDNTNRIVYEIKPLSLQIKQKNIIKEKALKEWCKDNNYEYKTINENYFLTIQNGYELILNQPDEEKLKKFIKIYCKNEN